MNKKKVRVKRVRVRARMGEPTKKPVGAWLLLAAVCMTGGCARTLRIDQSPISPLAPPPWSSKAPPRNAQSPPDAPDPATRTPAIRTTAIRTTATRIAANRLAADIDQAIRAFQQSRIRRSNSVGTAWDDFLAALEDYLDRPAAELRLSPLIRARIVAEFELDVERRFGVPAVLEERVAIALVHLEKQVRVLQSMSAAETSVEAGGDLLWPLERGVLSSPFGLRRDPIETSELRFHAGIDLSATSNEPVLAAGAGVVVQAGWSGPAGRLIRLRHQDGRETQYGHLAMILVGVGQEVSAGDVLGLVGESGRTTGPHLHFALIEAGQAVDPIPSLAPLPIEFTERGPAVELGYGD